MKCKKEINNKCLKHANCVLRRQKNSINNDLFFEIEKFLLKINSYIIENVKEYPDFYAIIQYN